MSRVGSYSNLMRGKFFLHIQMCFITYLDDTGINGYRYDGNCEHLESTLRSNSLERVRASERHVCERDDTRRCDSYSMSIFRRKAMYVSGSSVYV